jgi:phosphoribosylglycinamide formyltransferase 1
VAGLKVGVLISGRGSNLKSLIESCREANHPARIVLVVSNRADALGLSIAAKAKIPTKVIDHRGRERQAFETDVDAALAAAKVELVCLAGFMRVLTPWFVDRWKDRLINIHPSLLPAFPGIDVHRRAIEAGVRFTGCTVHFVRPETDQGPIIIQAVVPVSPDDDAKGLAARVLMAEHRIYPLALRWFAEGRVKVAAERVVIAGAESHAGYTINPGVVR